MLRKSIAKVLLLGALALGFGVSRAEDIDIFSTNTTVSSEAPNVLIYIDNTANWSQSFGGGTKFSAEKAALTAVISALKSQFRLGIMMATETGGGNSNTDGGYVRFAIQDMTDSAGQATPARDCLLRMVGAGNTCTLGNSTYYTDLDINADKSNGGKAGLTMNEAYDYFAGVDAYAGNNKVKADYTRVFTSGLIGGPTYVSPRTVSCQKNFIIVISNGPFQDNSSDTSTAMSQLSGAGGDGSVINPPDTSNNNNAGDEWTRFLNKVSTVQATTYTLEVGPSTTGQGPYNTSLLQSMGRQGKGGYFSATDTATLNAALTRIFNDIQAVNSVFASSSLPLSADNSGAYSDQVYMGVFRPDGQGLPKWLGNLKQYKFAVDNNNKLFLVDAKGVAAAGVKGFATPDAESFWTSKVTTRAPDATAAPATSTTTGSTGGFYFFDAKGSGLSYDLPDGEWVEKGGAAQQLRLAYLGYGVGSPSRSGIGDNNDSTLNSLPARKIYTCIGTCLTSGAQLAPSSNRATTWFEIGNTTIDSVALGLTTSVTVSSISNNGQPVSKLATGPSITTIAVANGNNKAATVTTAVAHGFSNGDSVTISGTTNATFNTTVTIGNVSATTFTFGSFNGPLSATGGSVYKNSSTKAFVTTSTAHALTTGQKVVISGATQTGFNTAAAVAITVLDTTNFTYTLAAAQSGVATGTIIYTPPVATATAAGHGFINGASITIAGASPATYNGTFTIKNVTTSTFDYNFSGADPVLPNATMADPVTPTPITATGTSNIRDTLVRWIRGLDTQDENGFKVNGADTDVRPSIHADILHSRPVVLNFAKTGDPDNVYVFYGGNDGIFRATKGGQLSTDGNELWGFIPQEFFKKFRRLYNNDPAVKYPSTPVSNTTAIPRDYFWDGPVGSYMERDNAGVVTKAWLFIAVRRGGRFIYALDVTTPSAPVLKWRKGCTTAYPDNSGCDAGFEELAQTWSQPQVIKTNANSGAPILIFGGGYDNKSEDLEPPTRPNVYGRAVYALDAASGNPLWSAVSALSSSGAGYVKQVSGMNFSVAADVLTVDRTLDGRADRLYFADVAGNIWRADIDDAAVANWKVWKIASLAGSGLDERKFLFSPDVVLGADNDTFDAVVIGSGDREHPLASNDANSIVNRVYMVKDTNRGTTGTDLDIQESELFDATNDSNVPANKKGWFITLANGEKVVNGPLVLAGRMFFGTNQPDTSNTSCDANLGIARRYDINFLNAAATGYTDSSGNFLRFEEAAGGGFLPSPVAGIVQVNGVPYTFVTDNPLSPGGVISPVINVPAKRQRTYWHEKLE